MADDIAIAEPSAELLRADTQSMLTYIHGARIVSIAREVAIGRLKGWLVERFVFGLVVALLAVLLTAAIFGGAADSHAWFLSALILMMLAARLGAIISIGRRMRDDNLGIGIAGDSIYTLATLGAGRNGLALALHSAPIFGLAMVAFFASGVPRVLGVTGGIAPVFSDTEAVALRDAVAADRAKARAFKADYDGLIVRCTAAGTDAATGDSGAATTEPVAETGQPAARPPAQITKGGATAPPAEDKTEGSATSATSVAGAGETDTPPAADIVACAPAKIADAKTRADGAELIARDTEDKAATAALPAASTASDKWLDGLRLALGLASVPDFYKLLIWVFIAGFFEQLVPDMLDNLRSRSQANQKKEEAAATRS